VEVGGSLLDARDALVEGAETMTHGPEGELRRRS